MKKIDLNCLEVQSIPMCFIPLPKKYQVLMNYKKIPFTEIEFSNLTVCQLLLIRNKLLSESRNFYENTCIKLLILDLIENLSTIIYSNLDYITLCEEIKNEIDSFIKASPYENRQILRSFIQDLSHHSFITDKSHCLNGLTLVCNDEFFKSIDNLTLNYYDLSTEDLALLKLIGIDYDDDFIIILDKLISSFNSPSSLNKLKKKIVKFLISLLSPTGELLDKKLITKSITNDLNFIDKLIVKYIEEFLFTLSEVKMEIATSSWGYNTTLKKTDALAAQLQLSKQYISGTRHRIKSALYDYIAYTCLPLNLLSESMLNNPELLKKELPILYKCFENPTHFYKFLKILTKTDKDIPIISQKEEGLPTKNIFQEFFTVNKSPVLKSDLENELIDNYGYNEDEVNTVIENQIKNLYLKQEDQQYYPINLFQKEAVAHALTFFPDGLPWKDVAKIVNHNQYSSTKINEKKLLNACFSDSKLIYLCSQGAYKNVMYFNQDIEVIQSNLLKIKSFLKEHDSGTVHLNDYYNQNKELKNNIKYFDLRHIIREFGESQGIYFNGKSGVERISLKNQLESVSQEDVIINTLNQSESGMTKEEISKLLRSKSLNHAGGYLNKLINLGEIVRIDKTMYSTPEKVFENVDTSRILFLVTQIVNSTNKIIEVDIFREEINKKMNLSYSKYFYGSLIKLNLDKLGFYNQRHLFSKEPIFFNSLQEIFLKQCLPELSFEENFLKLQEILLLTRDAAYSTIVVNGPRFFIESKTN